MLRTLTSVLIVILVAASLFILSHTGVSSRLYGSAKGFSDGDVPYYILRTSAEVYPFWKSAGVRGRAVIHFGRFLHYVGVDMPGVYEGRDRFPVKTADLLGEYEKKLEYRNFLRVAVKGNVARELYNVLPPEAFREKFRSVGGGSRAEGVWVAGDTVVTHDFGLRRTITGRIPLVEEPVLINIDASYFSGADAPALLSELKRSGVRTDLLTLTLSEDNPDVSEAERERLREFARLLGGR